jgi:hypothetical protein
MSPSDLYSPSLRERYEERRTGAGAVWDSLQSAAGTASALSPQAGRMRRLSDGGNTPSLSVAEVKKLASVRAELRMLPSSMSSKTLIREAAGGGGFMSGGPSRAAGPGGGGGGGGGGAGGGPPPQTPSAVFASGSGLTIDTSAW